MRATTINRLLICSVFLLQAIEFINQHVANAAEGVLHVSYIDCNSIFLNKKGSKIRKSLMPDLLHPSVEGNILVEVVCSGCDDLLSCWQSKL